VQAPIYVERQPTNTDPGGELSMHPRLSRFGVSISSKKPGHGFTADAKLEIDFQNGGRESRALPRMRHAYAELERGGFQVLFGQTWQLVSQLIPTANADTLMWGTGNTGDRSPQLRVSQVIPLDDKSATLTVQGAAMMMGTVNESGQAATNFGDVPAFDARIAASAPLWTEKEAASIALGAHYGHQELTEKIVGKRVFVQKGLFAELSVPVTEQVGVRGEAFFGENLADLRGAIGQGVNAIRDIAIRTKGFWAEAWVKPSGCVSVAAGVGQDDPNDSDLEPGLPSLNRAVWGVVHVKPLHQTRVGVEYLYWTTAFKDEARRHSHRFDVHMQWEF